MLRKGHPTRWMATIIGKPNAGKGTLFNELKKRFNGFIEVSLGDICRWHKTQNTELWKESEKYMRVNETSLWPSEALCSAVDHHLEVCDEGGVLIFDGLPRRTDQVELACELAHRFGCDGIRVFHVETADSVCEERAATRQRPDDAEIARRLYEYHEYTLPAISALLNCGAIHVNFVTLDSTEMKAMAPGYAQAIATLQGLQPRVLVST